MEHVGIVILNYNNSSDTINCIESVLKYTTVPIKIVVVDNGSNDVNSIIEISNYLTENVKKEEYVDINVKKVSPILLPKITLLKLEANLGYALGNKKGIELLYRDSSVESIMILNNDILFIDASNEFEKGKNQNNLTDANVEKIVKTFVNRETIEKYSYVASMDEIKENDYNLNIPRYVDTFEEEEPIDLAAVSDKIARIDKEIANIDEQLSVYLRELGL